MTKTIAVIQARMGSTRLPGKSLMPIWGEMTVLEMVIRRVQRAVTIDQVILATSDNPGDDPLIAVAAACSAAWFRGSEIDVLGRFKGALDRYPADAVARICADSPLIDPTELDRLVRLFWSSKCEYVSNCEPESGLPSGVGAEVLSASLLRRLDAAARQESYREHVTLMVREQAEHFAVAAVPPDGTSASDVRLDVDHPADLVLVRAVCAGLPAGHGPYWTVDEIVSEARLVTAQGQRG